MQTHFNHVLFNVQPANMPFYKDLMAFLNWSTLLDSPEMLGVLDKNDVSLWFTCHPNQATNDYDGPGVNHLAIGVATQADVDTVAAYLTERDVELLFETPRHRPEFSQSEEHTYYQIMFETPDRILLEIVYMGPKAA